MPNESFPRNWFSGSEYRPQRVENMATYVRDKENPLGTYVAFKILSATHAKLMVSLHQNLAPAIKRHAKH